MYNLNAIMCTIRFYDYINTLKTALKFLHF